MPMALLVMNLAAGDLCSSPSQAYLKNPVRLPVGSQGFDISV